jgi:acetylornithine deacetylase/succinyl-diaminopimelate desuccinylase-like protein
VSAARASPPAATAPATPATLLQQLIRFDTSNPPGNERPCIVFLEGMLRDAGLETKVVAPRRDRPSLVARLPGRGAAPPLLVLGHADVVGVEGQQWSVPPFEGHLAAGVVWGRGALDMKGGLAMVVHALLRARANELEPAGDVLFAVVADEEVTGELGTQYLVERHADLFAGVRYAIGEDGGTTLGFAGPRLQPIVVAEKRPCRLFATLRGPASHGALVAPPRSSLEQLADVLSATTLRRLPVRMTPIVELLLTRLADVLPDRLAATVAELRDGVPTEGPLAALPPADARYLDSVLRNTVSPTVVRAGAKGNVQPAEATVELDGRMLPGVDADEFVAEVRELVGPAPELEVTYEGPRATPPEIGPFYELLAGIVEDLDPDCVPVPALMTASTDARHFGPLGIAFYGFLPLLLPSGFPYQELLHAADERVPADALDFGAECIYQLLRRYE